MEKFERILVPLDGSDCAENVLPKVEKLAKDLKASIALLRVASAHTFPGADPTDAEVEVVREAEQYLSNVEERLKKKGLKVDSTSVTEMMPRRSWIMLPRRILTSLP
jgi:nucleotide-binding universal stress UspA family protein